MVSIPTLSLVRARPSHNTYRQREDELASAASFQDTSSHYTSMHNWSYLETAARSSPNRISLCSSMLKCL